MPKRDKCCKCGIAPFSFAPWRGLTKNSSGTPPDNYFEPSVATPVCNVAQEVAMPHLGSDPHGLQHTHLQSRCASGRCARAGKRSPTAESAHSIQLVGGIWWGLTNKPATRPPGNYFKPIVATPARNAAHHEVAMPHPDSDPHGFQTRLNNQGVPADGAFEQASVR